MDGQWTPGMYPFTPPYLELEIHDVTFRFVLEFLWSTLDPYFTIWAISSDFLRENWKMNIFYLKD